MKLYKLFNVKMFVWYFVIILAVTGIIITKPYPLSILAILWPAYFSVVTLWYSFSAKQKLECLYEISAARWVIAQQQNELRPQAIAQIHLLNEALNRTPVLFYNNPVIDGILSQLSQGRDTANNLFELLKQMHIHVYGTCPKFNRSLMVQALNANVP